jgi:hypothetical protein
MPRFAVLAEDRSDADALAHIMRRHLNRPGLSIKPKGYGGHGALCSKGARDVVAWINDGITKFVVCHDADSTDPAEIVDKVTRSVLRPAGAENIACIAVPVQEIEAWFIADEEAINSTFEKFSFKGHASPESIASPKEYLKRLSREIGGRPLYVPKVHNASFASKLRLDVVAQKCRSFRNFLTELDRLYSA